MLIAADSKIPFAEEAFAEWGEVRSLATSEIAPYSIRDAEVLLVRSETRVDQPLLEGSRVRFVGTATIGVDHIDLEYLQAAEIGFAAAPGCNADSVKEYVTAALLALASRRGIELSCRVLGIVGVGNIGSRVERVAKALGMTVILNDPPLSRQTGDPRFVALDDLMEADFLTLHVPLNRGGADNTFHLFDRERLSRLKSSAVVLNTSRGPVVDNAALKAALKGGRLSGAVLDVWEGEPDIDVALMSLADLATSHIAGYSLDGKVRGTEMVYEAACRHFGETAKWTAAGRLPAPGCVELQLPAALDSPAAAVLNAAVRQCYDIEADDSRLRAIATAPPEERPDLFRGLRKNYPGRREFHATRVPGDHPAALDTLLDLGFAGAGREAKEDGRP